ncbi:transmembrane protein 9B-like [Apostichopus japonicus]|uniref:transmembrane protein 9B-like n=1 Tax=Stichopus japonicus TaxID=307972 RepID=UPI003AB42308
MACRNKTKLTLFSVVFLFSLCFSKAQFEDVRCKCVCPSSVSNGKPNITVKNLPAEDCDCGIVTLKNETECLKCECKFQSRNTWTMKVAVLFVITVIALMFIYFVALLIWDRSALSTNQPISVREENQATRIDQDMSSPSSAGGRSSWFDRLSSAQRRWKTKVQKQREDIFDNQTILS